MPPKVLVAMLLMATTTLGLGDTNIADTDSQVVTRGQLQEMVNRLLDNNRILKERINGIKAVNVTDSLSTMLRLLREESAEASWLIQARSRVDPVELYNEEWQPRSRNVIYMIYIICVIHNGADRAHISHRVKGFFRRMVVYLKDHSPYPDSSLFIVNLRI